MSHSVLYRVMNAAMIARACSRLAKRMQVHALLLERAHEAFGHAVTLRFADVGRCDRDAQPLHLIDPRVGDVLGAPVTAHPQAARDVLAEPAEGVPDALADRFERGPAIAELRHVPAEQLVGVMIDRAEEPAPALTLSVEAGAIGPPHDVRPVGGDRAVMRGVAIRRTQPARREEPVLAH